MPVDPTLPYQLGAAAASVNAVCGRAEGARRLIGSLRTVGGWQGRSAQHHQVGWTRLMPPSRKR